MKSSNRDLYDIGLSFRFEMTKHFKRKRLFVVGALALLIPLLFLIGEIFSDYESADGFASIALAFITFLATISGAMFAGDTIASEWERKTGLMLFPTPQSRVSIFAGKYLAALAATLLITSIYYLVVTIEIAGLFGIGGISLGLLKSYLIAVLYASSAVSIIYFFSSIFKKGIASTLVGFFLLFMILPILSGIIMMLEVEPWFIVTYSANLITSVLSTSGGWYTGEDFHLNAGVGVAVMIAYAIVFFAAGTWIAKRKDVE